MSDGFAKSNKEFDELWNFNDPSASEKQFQALIPEAKKSGDHDHYLQVMTQVARAQALQRKFEEAHKTLDHVQKDLTPKTPVAEIRYFLERGRVFNSSKKIDQAIPLFLKSFEKASLIHQDNLAVDAAHMLGIADSGNEKKLEWNLKAMAIAEKSKEPKAQNWLGSLYNNMGWTYHDANQFEKALEMFQKALLFREKQGKIGGIRIARWCVARVYRSLNKHAEAIEMQLKLEKELDQAKEKDGYVYEELGELYLITKKTDLAKKYFTLAFNELSKDEWLKANEAKRLQRMKELAEIK